MVAAILMIVMFCAGLSVTFSYGQPWDERVEVGILVSNIREYAAQTGLEERGAAFFSEYQVPKISEYIEKDHGMAAYYVFFPILAAMGFRQPATMYAWHVYSFLLFFSGVLAVFLILKELFSKPVIWFGGMLSYFMSPRFFAEGHYNNKDITFVSIMLWMLLFLIRAARTAGWKNLTIYAVFSAFLMNCKISGIAIWAFGSFFLLLYQLIRKRDIKTCSRILYGFLLSAVLYFALTPASWKQPVQFMKYCIENATHFARWNRVILFNGNMIQPAEKGLPYSYLPTWIMVTTPEHVLLLFAASCGAYVFRLVQRAFLCRQQRFLVKWEDKEYFAGMLMLLFWLPFAFLVFKSPTMVLYNGWRHCYFLYVPMILLFLYILEPTSGKKRRNESRIKKYLLYGLLSLGLISAAADLIYYHPYEYVYFNRCSRSVMSVEGFEGDYWNVSTLSVLRRFEDDYYQGEKLKVALMVNSGGGQTGSLLNSDKLQIVDAGEADYFLFNVSALHDRSVLDGYKFVSGVERAGAVISGVYVKAQK